MRECDISVMISAFYQQHQTSRLIDSILEWFPKAWSSYAALTRGLKFFFDKVCTLKIHFYLWAYISNKYNHSVLMFLLIFSYGAVCSSGLMLAYIPSGFIWLVVNSASDISVQFKLILWGQNFLQNCYLKWFCYFEAQPGTRVEN